VTCRSWKEEVEEEEEEEGDSASIAEVASVAVVGCRAVCPGQGLHCPWTDPSSREELAGWEPYG
jgi:hypothetical protein